MWQVFYVQAHQIAQDRVREANRERLAREAAAAQPASRSRFDGLRRSGAVVAAGIARRLDECVAREQLGPGSSDDRVAARG
jgi:hypothetical protein